MASKGARKGRRGRREKVYGPERLIVERITVDARLFDRLDCGHSVEVVDETYRGKRRRCIKCLGLPEADFKALVSPTV